MPKILSNEEHKKLLQEAARVQTLEEQLNEAKSTLRIERGLYAQQVESHTEQQRKSEINYQTLQDIYTITQAGNNTLNAWLSGLREVYDILELPKPDTTQSPNPNSFSELSTLVNAAAPYARLNPQERQVVDNALNVLRQPSQHKAFDGNNITDYVDGLIQNTNYQDPNSVLTSAQLVLNDLHNVLYQNQTGNIVAWNLLKTLAANPKTKTILEKADTVRLDTIARSAITTAGNYIPDIFTRVFDEDVSPFISKDYRERIAHDTILVLPSDKYTELPQMLAKSFGSINPATLESTLREKLVQILYHEKAETFSTWYQNSAVRANLGTTTPETLFADAINDIQRALKNPDERISAYERVRDTAQTLNLPIAPEVQQTLARRYLSDILSVGDRKKFEDAKASQLIAASIGEQGTLLAVNDYLTGQRYVRDSGQAEFDLRLLIEYKAGLLEAALGANKYDDIFSEKAGQLQNLSSRDQRIAVYERIGKLAHETPQAQAQTKILARDYLDQVLLLADKGRFDSARAEQFAVASLGEEGIASAVKDYVANQELKHTDASTQFSIGLLQQFEAELRRQLGEETYTIAFARHISNQGIESLLGLKESPIYETNLNVQSEINLKINARVAEQFLKEYKGGDNIPKNPKAVAALVDNAERLPVEARKILLGNVLVYIPNMETRTHYTEKIAPHLEATDLMQTYDSAIARTFKRKLEDLTQFDLGNIITLLRERISLTGEDNVPELLNVLLTETQLSSPSRALDTLSVFTQSDHTNKYVTDQTKASVFGAYIDHIATTQEPRDPYNPNKTRIDTFVEKYASQMPAETVGRVLLHNLTPRRDGNEDAKSLSGFSRELLKRTTLSESDLGNVVANVVRQILYNERTGTIRPISLGSSSYVDSSYVGLLTKYAEHIPPQELSALVNMSITSAASARPRYTGRTETGYNALRIYEEAGLSVHIGPEIRQNVYQREFEERTKDLHRKTDRDKQTFDFEAKKVVDFITAEASYLPASYFESAIEKFYKSGSLEHVRKIHDTAPVEIQPQLKVQINELYQTHRARFSDSTYGWTQDVNEHLTGIVNPK